MVRVVQEAEKIESDPDLTPNQKFKALASLIKSVMAENGILPQKKEDEP